MSSKIPSDAAAVLYDKKFYIIYVREDGRISGLIAPRLDEGGDAPPYDLGEIKMAGQYITANTDEPKVTAVSYTLNGIQQVRHLIPCLVAQG